MTIERNVYGQNKESIGDLDALNLVLAAIDRLNHHEGTTPHSQLWLEKLNGCAMLCLRLPIGFAETNVLSAQSSSDRMRIQTLA